MHLKPYTTRIYFDDTDAGGIVYHGNYLKIFERARTEQFAEIGFDSPGHFAKHSEFFVVADIHITYKHPIKIGDLISIETSVTDHGNSRLNIRQSMHLDGKTLSVMDTVLVWVGSTGRPKKIPEDILKLIKIKKERQS